jgi:hypothetical protein
LGDTLRADVASEETGSTLAAAADASLPPASGNNPPTPLTPRSSQQKSEEARAAAAAEQALVRIKRTHWSNARHNMYLHVISSLLCAKLVCASR